MASNFGMQIEYKIFSNYMLASEYYVRKIDLVEIALL